MTKAQEKVRELYPLLVWYQAIWAAPFIGGLAGLIAVVSSAVELAGMAIGVAASVAVLLIGIGGFAKQVSDRYDTIKSVFIFKNDWGDIGPAPIAFCTRATGESALRAVKLFRLCTKDVARFNREKWRKEYLNILTQHVFQAGVEIEAEEDGRPSNEYFHPITFVTLHDGKFIKRGGRKFFGVAYGKWVDVVDDGLSDRGFVGLVVHELKHRVLEQINPYLSVDQQHEIMGADLQDAKEAV